MKNAETKYGRFLENREGAYELFTTELPASFEYIYQNRDILVRVDQYGVVNAQAKPPYDILLFKREWEEKYAKWLVWVSSDGYRDGLPVTGFGRPRVSPEAAPLKTGVVFAPEKAEYRAEYGAFSVKTELMVPLSGTEAALTTTVENTGDAVQNFTVTPAFCPYVSEALMAPWDKPEWYLKTHAGRGENALFFNTRLMNPVGDADKRRLAVLAADAADAESAETSLERFSGGGTFYAPDALFRECLSLPVDKLGRAGEDAPERTVAGYPQVCALRYRVTLSPGESRAFTQVLSMQDAEKHGVYDEAQAERSARLLRPDCRLSETQAVGDFYRGLFHKRRIETEDSLFDSYVNAFLPLQMYWVASLDRGWPTGMRGVRDASNDFMGMLFFDAPWTKRVIEDLYSRERIDGWFPRQVAAVRSGTKHDLRNYADGGVFALELLYEYISETGDAACLQESLPWLNGEEDEKPLYEHMLAAIGFYLAPENVGEHGLCKIYEGDWLDAVNRAGTAGRGESVTVTNQVILGLRYVKELLEYGVQRKAVPEAALALAASYPARAEEFRNSLRKHAYNAHGFMNSVFTDAGRWLFSDCDEDGVSRMYGPANYYSILSGAADSEMRARIFENAETLSCGFGYRLFTPPLGEKPMRSVGRIASGDVPPGLWENGSVYNHGSQGFLARALAADGRGEKLKDVLMRMLPYDQVRHPVEETLGAPYAIVNCYQEIPCFPHRAGMPFLTGTVAMCLRAVYTWTFGIRPVPDGLLIRPCLEKGEHRKSCLFPYRGKRVELQISGEERGGAPEVRLSGRPVQETRRDESAAGRIAAFIPAERIREGAVLEVVLK